MLLIRTLSPPKTGKDDDESASAIPFRYLPYITRMFLAPFGSHLDDLPAAVWIFELFSIVSPFLKRLVLDFPFESLTPDDDHLGVYRYLRNGLAQLTNLQELVYMNYDINLRSGWAIENHYFWWCNLPRLKRLAIPPPNLPDWNKPFAQAAQSLPKLEQLFVRINRIPSFPDPFVLDEFARANRDTPLKIVQLHNGFVEPSERSPAYRINIEDQRRVELHSSALFRPHEPLSDEELSRFVEFKVNLVLGCAVEGTLWTIDTVHHQDPDIVLYLGTTDE
jgi:hypothetical protein